MVENFSCPGFVRKSVILSNELRVLRWVKEAGAEGRCWGLCLGAACVFWHGLRQEAEVQGPFDRRPRGWMIGERREVLRACFTERVLSERLRV